MCFSGWMDQRDSEFDRLRSKTIHLVKIRPKEAGLTQADVFSDTNLDEQIEADWRESGEPDLLEEKPPASL